MFQEQSSAPEPRVRQGLLNLCLHPGSETLEFARMASIPDLKSQGIHQGYVKLRPGLGGEAEFARVCNRVRQGMSKPGRVREGYGRGDAKVIQ